MSNSRRPSYVVASNLPQPPMARAYRTIKNSKKTATVSRKDALAAARKAKTIRLSSAGAGRSRARKRS